MPRIKTCLPLLFIASLSLTAPAQYQKAPRAISDILSAPATPSFSLSPARDRFILVERVRYPSIEDLSEPMLKLAGLRINPDTNGRAGATRYTGITVKFFDARKEMKLPTPANAYLSMPQWSPDGKELAFTNTTAKGIELWIANTDKGTSRKIDGATINASIGDSVQWLPLGEELLVQLIPKNRGAAPKPSRVPTGPVIQENLGASAPSRTYQDLLKNSDDVKAFDYYATSQLARVRFEDEMEEGPPEDEFAKKGVHVIGKPGIYTSITPSPDGRFLLVEKAVKPYSFLLPFSGFASEVEVWDYRGNVVYKVASRPNEEGVPLDGVPTGRRNITWVPMRADILMWVEALDEGNPKNKVSHRDKVMMLAWPFKSEPIEIARTEHRYAGMAWSHRGLLALLNEYDRDKLRMKTWLIDAANPGAEGKLLWDRSINDAYSNPGSPVMRPRQNGQSVMVHYQRYIYMAGQGASPQGDRPFLDRLDLTTLEKTRIFQSDDKSYESFVALLSDDASRFLTSYETIDEPPNIFLRSQGGAKQRLTNFPDPAPQMKGVTKRLVTYKRADGVDLSFTLYLPPNYKEGTRLPTIVWAYPLEYTDPATAGQVRGSTNRFTAVGGTSQLFLLLQGYAVLNDATMPIIGDPETVNNTFVEQLVSSAKAAIDKAAELGVTDPNRVGVMGHSYGAFMTANLLAHSDLFKAGVARSGAYNRTLTPFGFQSERRTLWEAPETYMRVSPFMYADKINEPLLLIHGVDDNNPGTFPMQSERLFQAIKGHGGTVRLVMLPFESHGYSSRESIEHVLWETIQWFDKYVKNAK